MATNTIIGVLLVYFIGFICGCIACLACKILEDL